LSNYDDQYKVLVNDIIDKGISDNDQNVRPVWKDGTPAYSKALISRTLTFSNESKNEVPMLTTKDFSKLWKNAIHEVLWFYVHRTSDTTYLDENNVKIWRPWTRKKGNIGLAYGHQLGKKVRTGKFKKYFFGLFKKYEKMNQVEKLIYDLKNNPASRRHVISLWSIEDAWDMALQPCVWNNQWLVKEGKLHLIVGIRSNDTAVGQPFNVFQYYVLQRMISQITGIEMGTLTFNINDCHIYERHIDLLQEQVSREPFESPMLFINPDVKNFDDFKISDFELINYKSHESVKFEIAI
jgi:thymidylate synthase